MPPHSQLNQLVGRTVEFKARSGEKPYQEYARLSSGKGQNVCFNQWQNIFGKWIFLIKINIEVIQNSRSMLTSFLEQNIQKIPEIYHSSVPTDILYPAGLKNCSRHNIDCGGRSDKLFFPFVKKGRGRANICFNICFILIQSPYFHNFWIFWMKYFTVWVNDASVGGYMCKCLLFKGREFVSFWWIKEKISFRGEGWK